MRARVAIAPALLLALPPLLAAQDLLTPETLWRLARVSAPKPDPAGKALLYAVRTFDLAADRGTSQVFLLERKPGAVPQQITTEGSNSEPFWLADGAFAYLSTRSGEAQLWLQRPGEKAVQVTRQPGGVANVQPVADGGFLHTATVKVDPDLHDRHPDLPKANARAYDDLMVRHWDTWKDGTYSHLFVQPREGAAVDLMAGERADTPMPPFGGAEQLAVSPDGKEICYTCKRVADPEASTDSALWVMPVTGGKPRNLTPELPGYDQDPVYSPDGRWIAFSSMARAGFEADRMRVFVHDRESGKNRELLPDFDASPHGKLWSADSKVLYFTVELAGSTQIGMATLDGAVTIVTKGRQAYSDLALDADGRTLFALRSTMERPAEIVQVEISTGRETAVTDHNGAIFSRLALPTVHDERFATSDGKQVQAFVIRPPHFDPVGRTWPLILYCQGGPQSMIGQSFSFRWNFHLMAANGYVVAAVNRRGLPGFGQAWNDQISRDWGGQAMADLLVVADAMQARPEIEAKHTAAVGASFGGYTTYWLMGNGGDRFAAMIAHCGVFNLESMYLSTEELFFVNWDLGGPYWHSPEVAADYARFSPHRYVQNWKTPLLVIHGERDYRVPLEQGLQAFTAAQLRGVPSRLLSFPEEGHWVLRPQNGVLWHREFFTWLDRWCKPK